jgi:hypothetical protein
MTIENVTPEKFESVKAQLIANHTEVKGDTIGVIDGHGVTANFSYDPTKQELTVDVTHHAFFIPVCTIEDGLRKAFAA